MSGIRIGKLFGIEIAIHPSWFVILVLFAFTLATSFFPRAYHWSPAMYWGVAVAATLLLFASVLIHELGHSLVARAQGIPVKNITLFLLGGVSTIEKEAASPGREALLAGVGPLVSLLIGLGALGLARTLPGPEYVVAVCFYLGVANLSLAAFNLLPGFPLDGGRVLRAIFWWRSRDFFRATRRAALVGQVFGYLFIAGGVAEAILAGAVFGGVWLAFIGWVLIQASRASVAQVRLEQELAGVSAASLAAPPQAWLPPFVTLEAAAQSYFAEHDETCLPVEAEHEGDAFDGVVCLDDLRETPRRDWASDRVRDVMTAAGEVVTVQADTPATEALRVMNTRGAKRVAVMDGDRLVGFLDRAAALRYLRRRELLPPSRAA